MYWYKPLLTYPYYNKHLYSNFQEHLSSKSESQLKEITSTKVGGSTPLICASREGHLDIVRYLIVKCHADMKQCGSVVFDGETIEGKFVRTFSWKTILCLSKSFYVDE